MDHTPKVKVNDGGGGYRDSDGIWTTPQKVIVRSWSRSKSGQGQIYVTKSMTVTIYARTV